MLTVTGIHNQALNDKQVNHQNPFSILSKNPLTHAPKIEWIKFFRHFILLLWNTGSLFARHNKNLIKIFYPLPAITIYVCLRRKNVVRIVVHLLNEYQNVDRFSMNCYISNCPTIKYWEKNQIRFRYIRWIMYALSIHFL